MIVFAALACWPSPKPTNAIFGGMKLADARPSWWTLAAACSALFIAFGTYMLALSRRDGGSSPGQVSPRR
jgi:hypothetical protein